MSRRRQLENGMHCLAENQRTLESLERRKNSIHTEILDTTCWSENKACLAHAIGSDGETWVSNVCKGQWQKLDPVCQNWTGVDPEGTDVEINFKDFKDVNSQPF